MFVPAGMKATGKMPAAFQHFATGNKAQGSLGNDMDRIGISAL